MRLSTRWQSHTGGPAARARYRFSRKGGTPLPCSNATRIAWIWSPQDLVELVTDDRLRCPYRKAWRPRYLLSLTASERHQRTCEMHWRRGVRSARRRCQRQRAKPSRSGGTAGAPPRRKPPPESPPFLGEKYERILLGVHLYQCPSALRRCPHALATHEPLSTVTQYREYRCTAVP